MVSFQACMEHPNNNSSVKEHLWALRYTCTESTRSCSVNRSQRWTAGAGGGLNLSFVPPDSFWITPIFFMTWNQASASERGTSGKGSVSAARFRCDQQRKQDTGGSVWLLPSAPTRTVLIQRLLGSLLVHTANAVITGGRVNYTATGGKRQHNLVGNAATEIDRIP